MKKKVFNLSELHFSEVTSYKIHTLTTLFLCHLNFVHKICTAVFLVLLIFSCKPSFWIRYLWCHLIINASLRKDHQVALGKEIIPCIPTFLHGAEGTLREIAAIRTHSHQQYYHAANHTWVVDFGSLKSTTFT